MHVAKKILALAIVA